MSNNNTSKKLAKTICKVIVTLGFPFYMICIVVYAFWLLTRKPDYKIDYLEPATVGDLFKLRELAEHGDKEADDLMAKTAYIIAGYVFARFYGAWICETLEVYKLLGLE